MGFELEDKIGDVDKQEQHCDSLRQFGHVGFFSGIWKSQQESFSEIG